MFLISTINSILAIYFPKPSENTNKKLTRRSVW